MCNVAEKLGVAPVAGTKTTSWAAVFVESTGSAAVRIRARGNLDGLAGGRHAIRAAERPARRRLGA